MFKLAILIILLLTGVYCVKNFNKNSDIEIVNLKKNCTKDADDYVSKSSSVRNTENPTYPITSYSSYYSFKLKTCLVNISRNTSQYKWYYAIIDIYSNKVLAYYILDKTNFGSSNYIEDYRKYESVKNKYFPQ